MGVDVFEIPMEFSLVVSYKRVIKESANKRIFACLFFLVAAEMRYSVCLCWPLKKHWHVAEN